MYHFSPRYFNEIIYLTNQNKFTDTILFKCESYSLGYNLRFLRLRSQGPFGEIFVREVFLDISIQVQNF